MPDQSTPAPTPAPSQNQYDVDQMNLQIDESKKLIRNHFIRRALTRLKQSNERFLFLMDGNQKWRKLYNGLLSHNRAAELSHLVELRLCQAKGEDSYFNPFAKMPITMCYNRFRNSELFQKKLLFHLVLLYDSKVRPTTNWNEIEATAKSTIRALNISGLCGKNKIQCFRTEVKNRVQQKDRFKGKQLDFDKVYGQAIEDMDPISQITIHH